MRFLLISTFVFLCMNTAVFAQAKVPFSVFLKNKATGKKESGVTVTVYEGSSVVSTSVSDGSGTVKLILDGGKKYKVEFTKGGKVTRFVSVDLKNVTDELLQGSSVPKGELDMSMFDQVPNVDFSYVTSNPATEYYFNQAEDANLKYDEVLADKMIKKVDKLLKDAEAAKGQNEAEYNNLIKQADGQFAGKKYQEALASYEQALTIKPTEKYPSDKINEIDGILKAEKANAQQNQQAEQEYQSLITAADNLFNQKKFEEAKARYQEALTKKQEQHPKDQIIKCDAEIARLKKEAENAQKYTDAIKAGDSFFTQKSFQAAKDKYKEALKWKAEDPYATGKLAEIDGKLNAQKAEQETKKKYDDANAAGDALFAQEKWAEAKAKYNEALAIIPSSTYTQGKIKEVDAKLAEIEKEKAKQEQIAKLLTEGNTAFTASQWVPSKTKYQEVLKLDPENATATARITEIDAQIADEKANAERTAKIKQLVLEGDGLVKQTKLAEGKAKYVEALALKADPAVQAKIDAVDAQLLAASKKAEQKQQFDKAMADGEALFAAAKYEEAKVKFQEAQTIDPAQTTPKPRIAEADKKIAELASNAQKAEKYAAAMAAGNNALAGGELTEAKTKFTEAVGLDGTKQEAKDKLAEVNKLIADQAAAQANKVKYDAAIKAGDDFLAANKLPEAKAKFTEAVGLDANQVYPKQKLTEIEGLLASAEKQKEVNTLIKEGDAALTKKDAANARAKYQQALVLDPGNAIASAKMQEVAALENQLLGEAQKEANFKKLKEDAVALYSQAKYQEAKQKMLEAKTIKSDAQVEQVIKDCDARIAELGKAAEAEQQYNTLVAEAQGLENSKQYDQAIAKYNEALKIKNEQLPKDRIAAINEIKKNSANQAKYEAAVTSGNELLAANKLAEAKAKFEEAQTLDPNQLLPKQKIEEIENRLASLDKQKQVEALIKDGDAALTKKELAAARGKYQQALTLDPGNTIATAKMQEVAALENQLLGEAQKEANFKKLKDDAVALMGQAKYAEAKQKLAETKTIKQDAGVDQLIKECDAKMAELNAGAEKDKQYMALVNEAQGLENAKQYDQAIAKYNDALKIKNEQLPKDRIEAINQLKAANANQAKIDADYAAAMKKGNDLFAAKSYVDAVKAFNEALAIKPNEKEPVDRAAEAQKLAEGSGDEFEAQYQKVLTVGQKYIDEKNYPKAQEMYTRALGLKKNDPFPQQKLDEIAGLIKAEEDLKKKQVAYTNKVNEAETAAKAGNVQNAITLFEQAKTIKPDETLPDNRIAELRAQLEGNNAAQQALQAKYQEFMSAGATAEAGKDYSTALARYKDALSVKAKDKAAQDKIAEMQQVLDNAAKLDAKRAEIQKLIEKANAKFDGERWLEAKALYESALALDGSNQFAKDRVAQCDKKEFERTKVDENREYQKILTKADKNFDAKDYDQAKNLYKRAISFRANDPYPKQRLAEIEAILNPQPVVANKEPDPLKALGQETDNSILEGSKALEEAEVRRKGLRNRKFRKGVERAEDKSDSLMTAQKLTTDQNNITLGVISKENSEAAVVSDENRQENIGSLKEIDQTKKEADLENGQYETAENLDAKNQIDIANRIQQEQSGVLDGYAANNDELLKANKKELENQTGNDNTATYERRLDNETEYMKVQLGLEADAIDDFADRVATEHIVRDASNSVVEVTQDNQIRTNETLEAVKQEVDNTTITVAEKQYEETKQSPVNKEALIEIEKAKTELSVQDDETHLQNTLAYQSYTEGVDKRIEESVDNRDAARKVNVDVMEVSVISKEEVDRGNYNELFVKTLNAKGAITNETIKQDQYAEIPQTASNENIEKIKKINDDKTEGDRVATAVQVEKHQGTQGALNQTTQTVQENSTANQEQSRDNQEILKEAKNGLGQTELSQNNKQEAKTQSAKQLLAAIEKKEIVYNNDVANDLGKLYPEGVSQEQFEQFDEEGLLTAVVTRRVVIKNGHGDIYVRNQKLSGLTFTKNGEPTTEYVWQRETQDATLKRNY
jgi:epidermal growth factor receptor substrate 15